MNDKTNSGTKKSTVILVSFISIALFGALIYYGFTHVRGVPVIDKEQEKVNITIPFIDKDIDFAKGIEPDIWKKIEPQEIKLMYQVTILPWGISKMSPLHVKAFHNKDDIYFYITWKDVTEDRVVDIGKFSDATAIMFPLDKDSQPSTIMMGFLGKANIWQWKASQDKEYWLKEKPESDAYVDFYYPFEEEELYVVSEDIPQSAVNDLIAIRIATITPKEKQIIIGRGYWDNGIWQVVFKRQIVTSFPSLDAEFPADDKILCAFAVWNGSDGDRGGRKSISNWVELEME